MDRRVLLIASLVLLLGLTFIAFQQLAATPAYAGVLVEPAEPAPSFALQSDQGPVTLEDLHGKTVLLYFGYTYCPDVCPTTLSTLKKVYANAGDLAEDLQVVFITVDPQRDTPARMGEYARFFEPAFLGLSGNMEDTFAITDAYQIHFHYNDAESDTNYTVDHTSVVIVIDPQGNKRLVWQHGTTPEEMLADLDKLARE